MSAKTLTTAQLAYMWGVTTKTIAAWTKGDESIQGSSGWLFPAKVRRGIYDAHMANRLYIENQVLPKYEKGEEGETYEEAKRRKEIAVANMKELQEAEARGNLIDRDQAIQWLVALVSEAKIAFMAMPRRLAPVVYGVTEIRDIETKIRSEITAILHKLSRPTRKNDSRATKSSSPAA